MASTEVTLYLPPQVAGKLSSLSRGMRVIDKMAGALPPDILARIDCFANCGSPLGFLLIKGLPVNPYESSEENCGSSASTALLLGIGGRLGLPVGYPGQHGGALIHEIRPLREDALKQLATGAVTLSWHTEDAHTELNPDFVALLCVRGDPHAKTMIARIEPDFLDPMTRLTLSRREFVITPDESYTCPPTSGAAMQVLAGPPHLPSVRFDPLYTSCPTADAQRALVALNAHFDQRATAVALESGDLLLIDNRCAVHARSAFDPKFDQTDRWLRRARFIRRQVPQEAFAGGKLIGPGSC